MLGPSMKKPKLRLVSNNPDLKTYYVPYTTIQVDYYPVKALSPDQAIVKANNGEFERLERRVTLNETHSNVVYDYINVEHDESFNRNIDVYQVKEQNYDHIYKEG